MKAIIGTFYKDDKDIKLQKGEIILEVKDGFLVVKNLEQKWGEDLIKRGVFENQDIINECEISNNIAAYSGCPSVDNYHILIESIQKAISQTEKETREKTIREIEEKLPEMLKSEKELMKVNWDYVGGFNVALMDVKSILNQLKDNE